MNYVVFNSNDIWFLWKCKVSANLGVRISFSLSVGFFSVHVTPIETALLSIVILDEFSWRCLPPLHDVSYEKTKPHHTHTHARKHTRTHTRTHARKKEVPLVEHYLRIIYWKEGVVCSFGGTWKHWDIDSPDASTSSANSTTLGL